MWNYRHRANAGCTEDIDFSAHHTGAMRASKHARHDILTLVVVITRTTSS